MGSMERHEAILRQDVSKAGLELVTEHNGGNYTGHTHRSPCCIITYINVKQKYVQQ